MDTVSIQRALALDDYCTVVEEVLAYRDSEKVDIATGLTRQTRSFIGLVNDTPARLVLPELIRPSIDRS